MDDLRRTRVEFYDLAENAMKLGEYYYGARDLYKVMTNNSSRRERFASFTITPIEIQGKATETLNNDWYYIPQVVYYRHTRQSIPVSVNGFKSFYGRIVRYERLTNDTEFVLNCELKLVLSLTELHPATVLGIQKPVAPFVMSTFSD
jgi:hypothetical protein